MANLSFSSGFVRADALSITVDGYALDLRLPWMRALPWSSVLDLRISIGDSWLPEDVMMFKIRGQHVGLGKLTSDWTAYWPIGVPITVHFPWQAADAGSTVRVGASVLLAIPYAPMVDGKQLEVRSSIDVRLTANKILD